MTDRQQDLGNLFPPIPTGADNPDPLKVQGELAGLKFLCNTLFILASRRLDDAGRSDLAKALQERGNETSLLNQGRNSRFAEGVSQVLQEAAHAIRGN